MGYDMDWVQTPEVPTDGYFRLNVWGMGDFRRFMRDLGMIHNVAEADQPPWPDPGQYGLDASSWSALDDQYHRDPASLSGSSLPDSGYLAWRRAEQFKRAWAPEAVGIPVWKLCSNDMWLVGPVECGGAVKRWEEAGCPNPCASDPDWAEAPERWSEWMAYPSGATEHGGFTVA